MLAAAAFYRQFCQASSTKVLIYSLSLRQFHKAPLLRNTPSVVEKAFKFSRKGIDKYRRKDNVPNDFTLIYKAPLEFIIRIGYPLLSLCTISVITVFLNRSLKNESKASINWTNPVSFVHAEAELWFFIGALLLISVAGFSVMFKFPFRVYKHNSKREYIAMFISVIPFKLNAVYFKKATLTHFKNPLYFFMVNECHYFIDNKKAFLLYQFFHKPIDLHEMTT